MYLHVGIYFNLLTKKFDDNEEVTSSIMRLAWSASLAGALSL